jgi:hypothetical protein
MACPITIYTVLKDFSLPLAALIWAVFSWYRDNKRRLSIRQVGSSITDRVTSVGGSFSTFSIEVTITNDSPRANVVIAYYDLELPWKDDELDPLWDPRELYPPSDLYEIPFMVPLKVPRDSVLNHRRYQNGKLAPGEAFRGSFLAKGHELIPSDLLTQDGIEVRFVVQDTLGRRYRSDPMQIWPEVR